ncbi:MAG TPA: hypothetical protein VFW28_00170 [Micropepsaceae bacterium]|nr:hypothetical protein [Micropepsaceae bacterium]
MAQFFQYRFCRFAAVAALLCLTVTSALAHGGLDDDGHPDWEWDFWVVTPLIISALLYSRGVQLLTARRRCQPFLLGADADRQDGYHSRSRISAIS